MNESMKWWKEARFGMIIHWGLYSVLAGEYKNQRAEYLGAWIMSRFHIPIKEYEKITGDFDISSFDADKVVRLARDTGMKYLIFTAKHHDGFAMYHSKVDKYNITDMCPGHRDPLRELSEACEKYDVKLCLYYSQALDWHEEHAGGGREPGNKGMFWGNNWDFPDYDKKDFSIYFEKKCKPQVKELLTQYGKIHLIWFDCPATINEEQSRELYDMVKKYQPGCLMNSRLGNGLGDYKSLGDNLIPSGMPEGDWEAVATLNDTWGYKYFDHNWKSPDDVISILSGLAGKGINYVLNIGPKGNGEVPEESVKILNRVGEWMKRNGEAVYSTERSPYEYDLDFGYITLKDNNMYLIISDNSMKTISLSGVKTKVASANVLGYDELQVDFNQDKDRLLINVPEEISADLRPVIKIVFEKAPEFDKDAAEQNGVITLQATMADIHNCTSELSEYELKYAQTDAVKEKAANKISINPLGCTVNWHDTENYISWDFRADNEGEYCVEIVTSGLRHGEDWVGGHKIRLDINGVSRKVFITEDRKIEKVETRYYTQSVTLCGNVHINKGINKVEFHAENICNNKDRGLNVTAVRFVKK